METQSHLKVISFGQTTQFWCLLLTIGFAPIVFHSQWIVGPMVNAVLILAYFLLGIRSAIILSFVPSVMALSTGLLPFTFSAMVPFVILGNIILVGTFFLLRKQNYFFRLGVGAFLKFAFLFFFARMLAGYFFGETFVSRLIVMMSWPQFATAVVGGLIAFSILKIFPGDGKNDH